MFISSQYMQVKHMTKFCIHMRPILENLAAIKNKL